jgi:cytoskeleton protein RodZ
MESLGQKLRDAREQHNFSLEQVARDTHISKHYLEALEEESFTSIPGETYIIGFLRNYAEYLSLNPEEIVTLYKNIRIQEQPLPMTELLERPRSAASSRILILLLVILAVLGAGGFLLYRFVIASPRAPAPPTAAQESSGEQQQAQEFVFQDEAMTRWFNLDDTIGFVLNGNTYRMQIINVDRTLTVKVPGGTLDMTVGQERQLDVNGDGRNDLRLLLNDLDSTSMAKRANLSLYKITRAEAPQVAEAGEAPQTAAGSEARSETAPPEAVRQETAPQAATSGEGAAVEPVSGASAISTADSPAPFRLSISFRGYCLFRYLVDNDIREERFFHKGESFSLDARNEVRLWISNAGVVRLLVAGKELEVGRPGAVTTKLIRWRREEDGGQYVLESVTVE